MLTTDTKRKIDYLRDVLVGKIPVPSQQIEQITLGLIYKFMSDIDEQNEELGGKSFFSGEYKKYAWKNIMDRSLAGHERVLFYAEGLEKMSRNKELPQLFRDIFKGAFLPFKDPAILDLFLKGINEFKYANSEELGNAFEYLLSTAASQGDAGQFRTPRHIIDFIVEVVDPQKEDKILDPACGTAGFLVSAYKHILKNNTDEKSGKLGSLLTSTERKKLTKNIVGYDISNEMVRLSLVNLYLHGFAEPNVYEYDTLSSLEHWDDSFDCLLANPPFMTPRGGIMPHNRFPIQANRSEVLFVDYITEHLTPNGKAGIIVPEGIIFQSGNVYKQLRKMLVEDGLWAVVSLPQGVFNPYSGVKTSILFFNNTIARQTKEILFVKVENDGYDLGAQRKPIDKNDLPTRLEILNKYKRTVQENKKFSLSKDEEAFASVVKKEKIAETGDYNLSADHYIVATDYSNVKWPMVELGEVCEVVNGYAFKSENYVDSGVRVIRITNVQKGEIVDDNPKFYPLNTKEPVEKYKLFENDLLISLTGNVGRVGFLPNSFLPAALNQRVACLRPDENKINKRFLFHLLNVGNFESDCIKSSSGVAQKNLSTVWLSKYKIILPSIEIQKEIVNELDGYQKIIDGAKQIVENYKPTIKIDSKWEIKQFDEICLKITDGTHITPKYTNSGVPFLRVTDLTESNKSKKFISQKEHSELIKRCKPEKGDILYSKNGTIGVAKLVDWDWEFSIFVSIALLKTDKTKINPKYFELFLNSPQAYNQAKSFSKSGTVTNLHLVEIKRMTIPLPDLKTQQKIALQLEEEQEHVKSAGKIIYLFEQKIKDKISEIWGE